MQESFAYRIRYEGESVFVRLKINKRSDRGWPELTAFDCDKPWLFESKMKAAQCIVQALGGHGIHLQARQVLGWLYLLDQKPKVQKLGQGMEAIPKSKGCPRCQKGLMVATGDLHGYYLSCLVCGNAA